MGNALGITDLCEAYLHHETQMKRIDTDQERELVTAGLNAIKTISPDTYQAAEKILVELCKLNKSADAANNNINGLIQSISSIIAEIQNAQVLVIFI